MYRRNNLEIKKKNFFKTKSILTVQVIIENNLKRKKNLLYKNIYE